MKIGVNWRNFVKENLSGRGLEIGAFHSPFPINDKTDMVYQDRVNYAELVRMATQDKNLNDTYTKRIKPVDVVSDASKVPFENETFDFVCTSHLFEHLTNPIKALYEWLRVTKTGGYVFIIVPDKRFTFDVDREITDYQHIVNDHLVDINETVLPHYEDFYVNVHHTIKEAAQQAYKDQANIHVHTFTENSLKELLNHYNFNVVDYIRNDINICVLIRKG